MTCWMLRSYVTSLNTGQSTRRNTPVRTSYRATNSMDKNPSFKKGCQFHGPALRFLTSWPFTVRSCQFPDWHSSWWNTPCLPSAKTCLFYSQLPSISGDCTRMHRNTPRVDQEIKFSTLPYVEMPGLNYQFKCNWSFTSFTTWCNTRNCNFFNSDNWKVFYFYFRLLCMTFGLILLCWFSCLSTGERVAFRLLFYRPSMPGG
jgi:hypothetical protein